jgi:hypothetical protein
VSGTIELAGNQPSVPRQYGVRLGSAGYRLQPLPSQSLSDLSQCTPLRIAEPESGGKVASQDAVLGGRLTRPVTKASSRAQLMMSHMSQVHHRRPAPAMLSASSLDCLASISTYSL